MIKKILIALALLSLSAPVAVAGDRAFAPNVERKLAFTDTQKAQAKEIRARFRSENEPLRAQLKQTLDDLKAAKAANDDARAFELRGTLKGIHEQLRARRAQQRTEFLSLLTAEQRTQLDQMKAGGKRRFLPEVEAANCH